MKMKQHKKELDLKELAARNMSLEEAISKLKKSDGKTDIESLFDNWIMSQLDVSGDVLKRSTV